MADLSSLAGQGFYVVGLGLSGGATARALIAAGARVWLWDDKAIPVDLSAYACAPTQMLAGGEFATLSAVILAPGIALTHPEIHPAAAAATAAGVEVIGDIELTFRAGLQGQAIGITGTNGKSTTTALVAHVLETLGQKVQIGGNFGRPLVDLRDEGPGSYLVLELSSYQLDLSPGYDLAAACLLNISADHLERHGGMAGYAAAKARIFHRAAFGVVTGEDAYSQGIAAQAGVRQLRPADWRTFDETPYLRGLHNQQNQAAACAMLEALGFDRGEIIAAMATFEGVAHRQEILGQANGWTFVNDSKATNVDSAARALCAFTNIHWLAGGQGKTGGVEELRAGLPNVTRAYLYGENRAELAALCAQTNTPYDLFETLGEAATAALRTGADGTLLLAPAAASWDQFKSFEVRGDAFRALVSPYLTEHSTQEHAA